MIFLVVNLFLLPLWCYHFMRICRRGGCWNVLWGRPPQLPPKSSGAYRIWIHAVSLGETKCIEPLVLQIKQKWPHAEIFKTSVSDTGVERSEQRHDLFDWSAVLPVDFSWISKKWINSVEPDLFILVENDYWPNLLWSLKQRGVPTLLVNGRLSERTSSRLQRIKWYATRLFASFDALCVQTHATSGMLQSFGIPSEKIAVTGNLKLHLSVVEKISSSKERVFITIASTHEGEEEAILSALSPLDPEYTYLIAPRHPQRFEKVAKTLQRSGWHVRMIDESGKGNIVIVNRMNCLEKYFRLSKLAIIGGSFLPGVGGHNILEPLFNGAHVIYGPDMHSQRPMVELVQKHGLGDECSLGQIKQKVEEVLMRPFEQEKVEVIMQEMRMNTEKVWEVIKSLRENHVPC